MSLYAGEHRSLWKAQVRSILKDLNFKYQNLKLSFTGLHKSLRDHHPTPPDINHDDIQEFKGAILEKHPKPKCCYVYSW